jgi:hypothetical protein
MHTSDVNTLFLSLFPLLGLWFLMLALFWRRLIYHHPAVYEAMGSPNFLKPLGAFSTLRFLATRAHRNLGDRTLSWIADCALIVFVMYICGFAWLIALTGFTRRFRA